MALRDVSDPAAVTAALDEYDRLGAERFLDRYGFAPARKYFVRRGSRMYPSKAIVAAAHGHQFGVPLTNVELYGGLSSAVPKLVELGFPVEAAAVAEQPDTEPQEPGVIYSWEEVGARFGFEPNYLGAAGGMVSRPEHNALLLMTHPGGARSIDYGDYWDGDDLIYTGRGKLGDQERIGQNRDLGDNLREVHVFEPAGTRRLRYLGSTETVEEWTSMATDARGDQRRVLHFRLRFDSPPAKDGSDAASETREPRRMARDFDPERRPSVLDSQPRVADPAEASVLTEQARQDHHDLLLALQARLLQCGWTEVGEIPAAIDLWGRDAAGQRWIFEAKTVRPGKELGRVRSGLAQLLEYRFLYGSPSDRLCLLTNGPIGDRQARVLGSLGICVLTVDDGRLRPGSDISTSHLGQIMDTKPETMASEDLYQPEP